MTNREILYKDGDRYFGEVNSQGVISGWGTYTFKNGSVYKGSFRDGRFNGEGELFDKTNNLTITGKFVNGKAESDNCNIRYSDGSKYKGAVVENMREGEGLYEFTSTSDFQYYGGSFRRDRFDRVGLLKFRNGSFYKGFFMEGVYHGLGEYKTPEFAYKGNFSNGYMYGEGLIAYNNG